MGKLCLLTERLACLSYLSPFACHKAYAVSSNTTFAKKCTKVLKIQVEPNTFRSSFVLFHTFINKTIYKKQVIFALCFQAFNRTHLTTVS